MSCPELRTDIVPRVEAQIAVDLKEALRQHCTGRSMTIERVDACYHMKYGQCNVEFSWVCDVRHEESCTRCESSLHHHGLSRKEDGVDTVSFQCESGEDDRIAEVDLKLMQIADDSTRTSSRSATARRRCET